MNQTDAAFPMCTARSGDAVGCTVTCSSSGETSGVVEGFCFKDDDESLVETLTFQDHVSLLLIEENIKAKRTKYTDKEVVKTRLATQFIGEGSRGSSTDRYRKLYGDMANTGKYTSTDIVMVASNGKRAGAIVPVTLPPLLKSPTTTTVATTLPLLPKLHGEYRHLLAAIEAGAGIIMDTKQHLVRHYRYNVGEVALANYLERYTTYRRDGREDGSSGLWLPPTNSVHSLPDRVR